MLPTTTPSSVSTDTAPVESPPSLWLFLRRFVQPLGSVVGTRRQVTVSATTPVADTVAVEGTTTPADHQQDKNSNSSSSAYPPLVLTRHSSSMDEPISIGYSGRGGSFSTHPSSTTGDLAKIASKAAAATTTMDSSSFSKPPPAKFFSCRAVDVAAMEEVELISDYGSEEWEYEDEDDQMSPGEMPMMMLDDGGRDGDGRSSQPQCEDNVVAWLSALPPAHLLALSAKGE